MKKRSLIIYSLLILLLVSLCGCTSPKEPLAETKEEDTAEVNQTGEGKRIYFAGPLFNEAEREYNRKIVAILEEHGYSCRSVTVS